MKIINNIWLKDKERAHIIPNQGEERTLKAGEPIFNEPTLNTQATVNNIPKELSGQPFLFSRLAAGVGFKVTKPGLILFLIDHRYDNNHDLDIKYRLRLRHRENFLTLAEFEKGEVLPNYDERLTLYGVYYEAGDEFRNTVFNGEFAIIFAHTDESYTPVSFEDIFEQCKALTEKPLAPLYGEALKCDEYYLPQKRGSMLAPSIAITDKGTIFAAIMCGPEGITIMGGETHFNYISIARSFDGVNFEDPIAVFDPDKEGPGRTFDPVLWTDESRKRVYCSYTQCAGTVYILGGKTGCFITYTDNPEDEVPVWSTPIRAFDGLCSNKPLKASDGYWYFASAMFSSYDKRYFDTSADTFKFGVHIYRTKDFINFEHLGNTPTDNYGLSEAQLAEIPNGTLKVIERQRKGAVTYSTPLDDFGNWTEIVPMRESDFINSKILNLADSKNAIKKLPSGNIIYAFHDNDTGIRDNLTVAISTDDGKSFSKKLLLDERFNCSYPVIELGADGYIYIIYDCHRTRYSDETASEILLAKITEQDILAQKLVTNGSILKRLVSRYGLAPKAPCFESLFSRTENLLNKKPDASLLNILKETKKAPTLLNYLLLLKSFDAAAK